MKLSRREMILGCITLSAIVIGLTFWLGEPKVHEWKQLSAEKEMLRTEIETNKKFISREGLFAAQLRELQAQIPHFGAQTPVTPALREGIISIAEKHGLSLPSIRPGKEKPNGSFYELNINCTWEGSLDALTKVLFDLQSAGSRYDISEMTIKPVDADSLKGIIEITCAYYRNDDTTRTDLEQ
jgi:Tfp pilus assembly protein PilO